MKLAVIGGGKMAHAMVFGILNTQKVAACDIAVSDKYTEGLTDFAAAGIHTTESNTDAASGADIVLVAVKPDVYPIVLKELGALEGAKDRLYISIAPGITVEALKAHLGFDAKVIRTMPNTPAMVGEGMTAVYAPAPVSETELTFAMDLFNAFGKACVISEKQMDAAVAVSGSSPAYVFMFIEALADGAVAGGLPRAQAYEFAAQAVLGSAKMVLETGKHPGELKDMVCSPGGTTIEAVKALEQGGFRASILDAMQKCIEKSKKMGQ